MGDAILDLEDCAREPIHIPGAIQPHGVLIVMEETTLRVLQASENSGAVLGISAEALAQQGLDCFLDAAQVDLVRFALTSSDPVETNPVKLQIRSRTDDSVLDGVVHRHDGFSILELEPSTPPNDTYFLDFYKAVSKTTARLQAAPSLATLLDEAAIGLRRLTGFDRVMIYRFTGGGEGEVLAESKIEALDSYLGLWYPASDIPEQARRMYLLNPIRTIPTATYEPVPLVPAINPLRLRPTDLTYATLRSVSPIHCEYMRNMGVSASMSVSIVRDGRLWGLIACHHCTTRFVPFETRKACTFLGQLLSGEIARRESEEESAYKSHVSAIHAKLLESMAAAIDPLEGLVSGTANLMDLLPAAGAAILDDERVRAMGLTPGYAEMLDIVKQLRSTGMASVFSTHSLKNHFEAAAGIASTASGLLAIELSRTPARWILFFRPEIVETVLWGGNPEKAVLATDDGFRLGPRKSFAAWREVVHGTAVPWTPAQLQAAEELRSLIIAISMKRGTKAEA